MSIAIVGAGAIGGYLGARLALAGEDVTFVARSNADAIAAEGITLVEEDGARHHAGVRAVRSMEAAGRHDIVLLTLKAHQVGAIAEGLRHLIGPDTSVVTMQNGIPWWYFAGGHGGAYEGTHLETADPGGQIARHLDPRHVIGSVVYPATVLSQPTEVTVIEGNRFGLGELDGSKSERVLDVSRRLTKAGFKAPVTSDIRAEIWLKLWGNLSFNPISALAHATLEDICRFPDSRDLASAMMREAEAIANKLGVVFKVGIDRRIAGAEKVGAHKTSMLQDVEAGRPLELEALVGSVIELGRIVEVPTPHIDSVYALMRLLAQSLERAGGRLAIANG